MADTTTARAKRKHSRPSYDVDDYFDNVNMGEATEDSDLDGEDSEPDMSFGSRKKPKKKKAKKAPKKKKRTPPEPAFRFMDLPPELRDEIYDLALIDTTPLVIVSQLVMHRRSVVRGTVHLETGDHYHGKAKRLRWWQRNNASSKKSTIGIKERSLIPNILAVSKQIREEASSVLYKQELIFEDMAALHTFVTQIGPQNRQLLSEITVKTYTDESPSNYAAFCALAGCTHLRTLFLDCEIGYHRRPSWLARQVFRDGRFFLEAYGAANGSFDAALAILKLADERHFDKNRRDRGWLRDRKANLEGAEVDPEKKQEFENTLKQLLMPPRLKASKKK